MATTTAPTLSPALTAYALEAGIDILTDTTAGAWGYYVATVPAYAPGSKPRLEGPCTGVGAIDTITLTRTNDSYVVTGIVARFPAGTPYAYTL